MSGAKNRGSGKKQDKKELRVEGQQWQLGGRHQSETAWLTRTYNVSAHENCQG